MDSVEVYELVLNGTLKKFPMYFWEKPESLLEAIKITKHLFENILHWDIEDIKIHANTAIFTKYKLRGMLIMLFKGGFCGAVYNAYHDKIRPWELKNIEKSFWHDLKNCAEATKWLIEEKLKWDDEQIKMLFKKEVLTQYGFSGMLKTFKDSPSAIINNAYPQKFKPWEFISTPKNYWNIDTGVEATKWLIEEKLGWPLETIKARLDEKTFINNNLGGMIKIVFRGSPFLAVKAAYPDKLNFWEMKNKPKARVKAIRVLDVTQKGGNK